jgi:hypothetical protein
VTGWYPGWQLVFAWLLVTTVAALFTLRRWRVSLAPFRWLAADRTIIGAMRAAPHCRALYGSLFALSGLLGCGCSTC